MLKNIQDILKDILDLDIKIKYVKTKDFKPFGKGKNNSIIQIIITI